MTDIHNEHASVGDRRRGNRPVAVLRYVPVILALIVGTVTTFSAHHIVQEAETRRIASDFSRLAADRCTAVRQTIDDHLNVLHAISGLYDASNYVSRDEFTRFATPMLKRYRSIQALEWIPRIPDSQREAYEAQAQTEGMTGFIITERDVEGNLVPAAQRPEYFPVFYVAPVAGNERAIGFDLASNPTRLAALELARDTGQPVTTARIKLVQETGHQYAVLMFYPQYRTDGVSDVHSRRKNLTGFVLGVYRMGESLAGTMRPLEPAAIHLAILDETAPEDEQLLAGFDAIQQTQTLAVAYVTTHKGDAEFTTATRYTVGGRFWRIVATAAPGFIAARSSLGLIFLTPAGLCITVLAAAYLHLLCGRTARVSTLVDERTAELNAQTSQLRCEAAERKRIEQSLHESEWRLRILAENVGHAFWLIDSLETELLYMSPAYEALTGLTCEHMYEDPRSWLAAIHPEDRERARSVMTHHGTQDVSNTREGEFRVVMPDGALRWLWMRSRPIVDDCGEIAYRAGVAMDITKPKVAEIEREQLNHQLARTNDELESRNEEILRLTYAITHDLQTPLATLNGAVDALASCLMTPASQTADKWMTKIQSSTARMVGMLNDLLAYARAGTQHIQGELLDVPKQIELAVDELRPQADLKGATIHCSCQPCMVRANPSFLLRVLLNVIGNAVKYLPPSTEGRVYIAASERDGKVHISVADNGPGIEPSRLADVFQPFKRANNHTQGTGLGLAIVRKYITSIHGRVTIDSDGQAGTTVGLVIPAATTLEDDQSKGNAA